MADNDNKETSMAASAPIEAEAATTIVGDDSAPRGGWSKSNSYKTIMKIYGAFFFSIALIILLTPTSLLESSEVAAMMGAMMAKMPGLVYLSSLSESPYEVIIGYCVALLTAPFHAVVACIVYTLSYKDGFWRRKDINNLLKTTWLFPVLMWVGFFTCLFCSGDPSWQRRMMVSSRLFVATVGQVFVALAVGYPAVCIIAYLQWRDRHKMPITSGEKRHAKQ